MIQRPASWQTVKADFNMTFELDRAIKVKLKRIQMLKDRAIQITGTTKGIRVSSSGNRSKTESAVVQYSDMQKKVETEINACIRQMEAVEDIIRQVPDASLRALLECRYLCFMTWEQVAVTIGRGWRHTMRLHRKAIQAAVEAINRL